MTKKLSIPFLWVACLGGIGLAFYAMMVFTPLFSDDWNYHLIFGTEQRITSLRDIFVSQYHHYFLNNGRFVPHFFVQLFDGLLGKSLFNIVNTGIFLVFLILLLRIQEKTEWRLFPVALALLLLLMPGFNNAFLWLSGACNYLWSAVLLLAFYRLVTRDSVSSHYYPLLFLFGIVCGWTNEALIVGFVAGCLCYYARHRKELTGHRKMLLGGLIVGALFVSFSPGSIHRFMRGNTGTSSVTNILHQLLSSLLAMDNLRLLPLLLLLYYRLLAKISDIEILQNVGDFRLLDRQCIDALCQMRESQRYTKGLFCWIGFKKKEIVYKIHDRTQGKSSWNLQKLMNLALDGITSFSIVPLRFSSILGFLSSLAAIVYMLYFFIKTLLYGDAVQGFPTLIVVILFLGGMQLFSLGIIGEYLGRIFQESKRRPVYVVSEKGMDDYPHNEAGL